MSWKTVALASDYATLAKQYRALRNLAASFEAQYHYYREADRLEIKARAELDGMRAINEMLTDDIDRLSSEVQRLRKIVGE